MTDLVGKILIGIVFAIMKAANHFVKNMRKMKIDKYNDFCDRRCKWCTSLVCDRVNDTEARDGCRYFRDEFPEEVKDVEYWRTLDKILEKS